MLPDVKSLESLIICLPLIFAGVNFRRNYEAPPHAPLDKLWLNRKVLKQEFLKRYEKYRKKSDNSQEQATHGANLFALNPIPSICKDTRSRTATCQS